MKINRREFVVGISMLGMGGSAQADLYDDYINSVSKQPFVSFFARGRTLSPVSPGHSFVTVGTELDNGLTVYEGIFGYYPLEGGAAKIMKFRSVDRGIVKFTLDDAPSKIKYRINIDESVKSKVLSVIDKWNSSDHKYNIFANEGKNCNSLSREVALAIGLRVPKEDPGLTWPENYLVLLRDANP